ncbi:preprotein translocase subunit SecY [Candidatus Gracilibacteria bacterium CG17_big_fil_post_rev_8_21_14_2_50_48_13]|nr:MAG: preprotein translocase subunit SecY [Candidatus Gracilibacteria bacterium CG17_big_fil_post_rev_8_21_14_2_50_48_13]
MNYLVSLFKSRDLRNKILFTLFILLVYKVLTHVPVPGSNYAALSQLFNQQAAAGGLADTFSAFSALMGGGNSEGLSFILMGLSPYINASIILQLLAVIIPKLEAISKDGQRGQEIINKYTRWLTVPLALLQSYGMILLLNTSFGGGELVAPAMIPIAMISVTAGSLLLLWLGEMITEKGIGNGVSILIFASIVTAIPQYFINNLSISLEDNAAFASIVFLLVITVALLLFVTWFTEAQRNIPITYAEHGKRGMEKSNLPIRLNQAGMVPIIFGVSMVTFPSIAANLIAAFSTNSTLRSISDWILANFNPSAPNMWYQVIFFLLTMFFSYFYVSIVFHPDQVAENIQKRGGFIPGVRPGKETAQFIGAVSARLTLWGGLFIALVAIFPYVFQAFTSSSSFGSVQLLISGAGLIIIVGVVLEVLRKIQVELVTKDYDKFY